VGGRLVPRLQTPRLTLRGLRDDDLDAYAAMVADAEVMRFFDGPLTRDEAWRQMALFAGHWVLRGYGQWAVERRADRVFLGRAGLWEPDGWPGLEVGWMLARGAWGQGYATEAARMATHWAWAELGATRLISIIAPGNERSIAVARRLGMERAGDWRDAQIFAADRPA
jgi:RimJ/RimL family protein N-acetyltransferase